MDLQNLAEHAADLEILGDITMVQEYRKEAILLSKRIKAIDASIAWINEVCIQNIIFEIFCKIMVSNNFRGCFLFNIKLNALYFC